LQKSTSTYTTLIGMLAPVKTLAHRVSLYLRRPSSPSSGSTSDAAQASDDGRPSSSQDSHTSEDGQSGCYPSSEEEDLQLVTLIKTATIQTSTCGSFIIDKSVATKKTNFPVASGGLGDVYKCILNSGATLEEVCHTSIFMLMLTRA
jgi:hypothetical protein